MSVSEPKPPNRIFRRKSDGKIVVQKDGKSLVTYDNARKLVEAHLKGLELKENYKKKTS